MLLVEPGHNQHEHWTHTALNHSQKESLQIEASVIGAACGAHHHNSPDKDDASGHSFDGEALG
jgi:hypothetical protein